jgi:hypothetical protein
LSSSTTDTYPYRPPKRFPQKDLHGRVRFAQFGYKDFDRFKKFAVNVWGWDMFELPETAGGTELGEAKPSLLVATGPTYETWEGYLPGHMNAIVHYDPDGSKGYVMMTEVHMDVPLAETVDKLVAAGATLVGELPPESDDWVTSVNIADPDGNVLNLWKCPTSRTWEEPEAAYDED